MLPQGKNFHQVIKAFLSLPLVSSRDVYLNIDALCRVPTCFPIHPLIKLTVVSCVLHLHDLHVAAQRLQDLASSTISCSLLVFFSLALDRSITSSRTIDQLPREFAAGSIVRLHWSRSSRFPVRTTRRPRRHCWRCGRVGAAGCSSPCRARRGPWSESSLSAAAASPASPAEGSDANK